MIIKTCYAKDIPKDWHSSVDSTLKPKVKDNSLSLSRGSSIGNYSIASFNSYMDVDVEDRRNGIISNKTIPELLKLMKEDKV